MKPENVFECEAQGSPLRTIRDATDIISKAWEQRATVVAIPAGRLDDDFFRLRTGVAGEILQKFVTYQLRVAIVGDISKHVSESSALRDFVHESNRGDHVWFVADLDELLKRLETPR